MSNFLLLAYPVLALIVGLVIGSFLNVVIYRIPLMLYARLGGEHHAQPSVNLWWPPSNCPQCQNPVWKRDNIPVLSWLLLKGKCRFCSTSISMQYPITEAIVGVWFTFLACWYLPEFTVIQVTCFFLFFCILYSLSVIDIENMLLPDSLVFLLLWCGLLCSVSGIIPVRIQSSLYGVVGSWTLLYITMELYEKLRHREGLGYGDVKLFAAVSAWLGIELLPELILISSITGGFLYLATHLYYKNVQPDTESHGEEIKDRYIPFGPAIAIGAIILFHLSVLTK